MCKKKGCVTFPLCPFFRPHIFLPCPSLFQGYEIHQFVFEHGSYVLFDLTKVDSNGGVDLGRVLKSDC